VMTKYIETWIDELSFYVQASLRQGRSSFFASLISSIGDFLLVDQFHW
jgi:hypothetical protein